MNIKALVSGFALCAAMAISAPAFADTMVGATAVMDADLPAVQGRCNDLMTAVDTPQSLADANDKEDGSVTDDTKPDQADTTSADISTTAAVDPLANATLTQVLENLTIDECKAAGLLK